jgi:DTW domain-containing protein YfiP
VLPAEPIANEAAGPAECPQCRKPTALCVCDGIAPVDNDISVLILQHPQEQDRTLGTARLATLSLQNAVMKIGLSWPSLSKILGRTVDPHRWAILYLGSAKAAALAPDREIVFVNRKGELERDQDGLAREIEGIVLLDGTWSQAKALWWRNPWMLKCRRVVLGPRRPSRYGRLRREPRRDGLSTIEAAGMLLSRLERRPEIEEKLGASFERMLDRVRKHGAVPGAPRP